MSAVRGVIADVNESARTAMVTVDAWDGGETRHGPCPYIPHPEPHGPLAADVLTHPRRGTECAVLEDNYGGLWIAAWRYSP